MTQPASRARIGDYEIVSRLDTPNREIYLASCEHGSYVLALFEIDEATRTALTEEVELGKQLTDPAIMAVVATTAYRSPSDVFAVRPRRVRAKATPPTARASAMMISVSRFMSMSLPFVC